VPGIAETNSYSRDNFEWLAVFDALHLPNHPLTILDRVKRLDVFSGFSAAVFSVTPLQVCGVGQQNSREFATRFLGENGTSKAALYQQWQAAAVVQVGVTEDHRVDFRRIEGERVGIACFIPAAALDEPAVQQDPPPATMENVAGAGDFARRAKKFKPHEGSILRRDYGYRFPHFTPCMSLLISGAATR
jgi:hypothetical protein